MPRIGLFAYGGRTMAKNKDPKTNAMRQLERAKIPYEPYFYACDERDPFSSLAIAQEAGDDPSYVYKTLVTTGKSGDHYVFVLPISEELDLKKAAKAVGEKSVAMVPVKDIESVSGYIRGGCSPVGMKKQFTTVFDQTAEAKDTFKISGGKRGIQLIVNPKDVCGLVRGTFQDILLKDE